MARTGRASGSNTPIGLSEKGTAMPHAHRFLKVFAIALALCAAVGVAGTVLVNGDEPPPKEKTEPEITIRSYRVDDLLRYPRDWSAWAVGIPNVLESEDTRLVRRHTLPRSEWDDLFGADTVAPVESPMGPQELRDLIQRTVNNQADPKVAAWADEGGPASIEYMMIGQAGVLLVTQTEEGHAQVAALFQQLRDASDTGGPMLSIHARWVAVDDGKVDVLLGANPKRSVPLVIDAKVLADAGARTAYRASTTTFDRMKVFVAAGNLKTYLADAEPVVSEAFVGMDPTIGCRIIGALFEVEPTLSTKGDTVLLDYRSYINHGGEIEHRPLPDYGMNKAIRVPMRMELDMPDVDFQTLRGSVRIPLDKTVLLGLTTGPDLEKGTVYALVVEVSASKP